ncbi:MAG: site-2 protease family protein [Methylococcales bacterium]|nr:site-2 protease family protein [Methylococcales bacterium]
MNELSLLQKFAIWVLPVVFAITVHEVAHGWVALRLGDKTASRLGRLTLNPIKHIDPVGTILIPGILLALSSGFIFGWAKPVPVDPRAFRKPRQHMAIVALAGPVANLLMALAWALWVRLGVSLDIAYFTLPMIYTGVAGITINLVLMLINLLPIPPLDGGRVLLGVLPTPLAYALSRIEPYGFIILLVLLYSNVISGLLQQPMMLGQQWLAAVAGL